MELKKKLQLIVKRMIDLIVSSCALLVLALTIFPIVALLIKLTSKGPIFYRWNVVGKDCKPFGGYKFRTMYIDADDKREKLFQNKENNMKVLYLKTKDDSRITPIGKILRKFSIDEFPELYSVLKGDLSLVGPKPPLLYEYSIYSEEQKKKLSVKPGMACLREVKTVDWGRRIDNPEEWIKLDLEYIKNWSLWLDFKILAKTAIYILSGKNI